MIYKEKQIEVNGILWWFQEFVENNIHEFNLYDKDGDFVAEFNSWDEMMEYTSKTFHRQPPKTVV